MTMPTWIQRIVFRDNKMWRAFPAADSAVTSDVDESELYRQYTSWEDKNASTKSP